MQSQFWWTNVSNAEHQEQSQCLQHTTLGSNEVNRFSGKACGTVAWKPELKDTMCWHRSLYTYMFTEYSIILQWHSFTYKFSAGFESGIREEILTSCMHFEGVLKRSRMQLYHIIWPYRLNYCQEIPVCRGRIAIILSLAVPLLVSVFLTHVCQQLPLNWSSVFTHSYCCLR